MASKSLIWHTFGSLAAALKEAGFDVPVGEERLAERAIADGAVLARELGHLPKMAEWKDARARDETLLSEWQVYRMVDVQPGAWSAFQFLVRERLREEGVRVCPDGTLPADLRPGRDERRGARGRSALVRRAHCRQLALFAIVPIRRPATLVHERTVDERHQPAFLDLGLAERRSERTLHDLERRTGGGEQDLVPPAGHPQGTADAASHVKGIGLPLVDPGGQCPYELLEDVRELRDARRARRSPPSPPSSRLVPHEIVTAEELVVVGDDPVVDPGHATVPDGMVVRGDRGVALRVVADVNQNLAGALGDDHGVEQCAAPVCAAPPRAAGAVCVADRVGALRDTREQRLGSQRPVHRVPPARNRDAAHVCLLDGDAGRRLLHRSRKIVREVFGFRPRPSNPSDAPVSRTDGFRARCTGSLDVYLGGRAADMTSVENAGAVVRSCPRGAGRGRDG